VTAPEHGIGLYLHCGAVAAPPSTSGQPPRNSSTLTGATTAARAHLPAKAAEELPHRRHEQRLREVSSLSDREEWHLPQRLPGQQPALPAGCRVVDRGQSLSKPHRKCAPAKWFGSLHPKVKYCVPAAQFSVISGTGDRGAGCTIQFSYQGHATSKDDTISKTSVPTAVQQRASSFATRPAAACCSAATSTGRSRSHSTRAFSTAQLAPAATPAHAAAIRRDRGQAAVENGQGRQTASYRQQDVGQSTENVARHRSRSASSSAGPARVDRLLAAGQHHHPDWLAEGEHQQQFSSVRARLQLSVNTTHLWPARFWCSQSRWTMSPARACCRPSKATLATNG
jgi:hypothetical protein